MDSLGKSVRQSGYQICSGNGGMSAKVFLCDPSVAIIHVGGLQCQCLSHFPAADQLTVSNQ